MERKGLKIDDIGLWELNAAFAVQTVYCCDKLGLPMQRLNVRGGLISMLSLAHLCGGKEC
jgi:acetyl-CoA C-acetyltransferase